VEKRLTSLGPFVKHKGKTKFCAHCGTTQEALFKVDEDITLMERYCDVCAKNVK